MVLLADPADGRAHGLHPAAVEGEGVAGDDRLVAEIDRVEAAVHVHSRRLLADREECDVPPAVAAEGDELVHDPGDRVRRPDGIRRRERVAAHVRIGDHRVSVAGEEVALAVVEVEVGERVAAVRVDELPSALAVVARGAARDAAA